MKDFFVLNKDGTPGAASLETYRTFFERNLNRICHTTLRIGGKKFRVSTVFLPCDHGFGGASRWFETMVFPGDSLSEKFCDRHETLEEAEMGHQRVITDLVNLERTELLDDEYWEWL